ncbi:hypothetical protein EST38_g9982 [Candolleomyces aberdarensis]|uniref:NYN domain-containing protein n=1 Tax=Candolleomyces aberdarensis TaxID=2316362 RepID=A0A4Q2D985_9AGAR|nr:hypothetical protein EST38_g9982 [Candolleomyces aberdarensis]
MNEPPSVSILWDAAAEPAPGLCGFEVVEAIRSAARPLGFVKGFKLYADIAGFDSFSHDFRFQVQCSGVTLVDTASSGRLGSATKMILVDSFIHALDNPSSCILILTVDPDICYGVSLLRLRGFRVFILSPSESHPSLGHFSMEGSGDNSMLLSERQVQQTAQRPQVSGHGRRASLRVPVQGSGNTGELSEQDILPTPTIQAFREQFAANSSLRTSSIPMTRPSIPSTSRSMTVSPHSRSSSSADQIFRTPKATVETDDEDDGDYITLTPPKQRKEKTPTRNGRSDDTPEPRSGSLSSNSNSSGFSIIPPTLSTELMHKDTPLTSNEKSASTSANVPFLINEPKASVGPASPDRPSPFTQPPPDIPAETSNSVSAARSEERQDLGLTIPLTHPEVKQPTPRRSTFPSFFSPPPLSPDRTPLVPISNLPASRPATAAPSLDTLRTTLSNNSKAATPMVPKPPLSSGTLLAQAQQTPKPASAPPSASITNPFTPPKAPAVKVIPPVAPPPKAPTLPVPGPSTVPKPIVPVAPTRAAGTTPQPTASASGSAATSPAPPPPIAPHFAVLVQHLKTLRDKGQNSVDRSSLGMMLPKLQSDVYVQAQVSQFNKPFRKYCDAAEKAGIVVPRGFNALSLHPAYH